MNLITTTQGRADVPPPSPDPLSPPASAQPASPPVVITSRVPDPRVLRAINPFLAALLRSPFHGLLSQQVFLLTYTGRRSDRRYTLPLGYVPGADALLVVSSTPSRSAGGATCAAAQAWPCSCAGTS